MTAAITQMLDQMEDDYLLDFVAVSPSRIALISNPSHSVKIAAVKANHAALSYIKDISPSVLEAAIFRSDEDPDYFILDAVNRSAILPKNIEQRLVRSKYLNINRLRTINFSLGGVASVVRRDSEVYRIVAPNLSPEDLFVYPNNFMVLVLCQEVWTRTEACIYDDYVSVYIREKFISVKRRYLPMRTWYYD